MPPAEKDPAFRRLARRFSVGNGLAAVLSCGCNSGEEWMLSRKAAILALGASLAASPALANCKLSDIQIKSWDWRVENGFVTIVGEFVNSCAEATSVEFQAVMRDTSGRVVDVYEFYSSGDNIPSGESSAFNGITPWKSKSKTVELKVIHVQAM